MEDDDMRESLIIFEDKHVPKVASIKWIEDQEIIQHICTLKSSSIDYFFSQKPKFASRLTVSKTNPETKLYFTSTFTIEQEIIRQINSRHWYVIHPLSDFACLWKHVMFFTYMLNWFIVLFQVVYHKDLTVIATVINVLIQIPCWTDICIRFNMGIHTDYEIEIHPRQIASHYIRGIFFVDLLGAIPFQMVKWILVSNQSEPILTDTLILYQAIMKIMTARRITRLFKSLSIIWQMNFSKYMIISLTIISILFLHFIATLDRFGANIVEILEPKINRNPLNVVPANFNNSFLGKFWYSCLFSVYMAALRVYCFTFVYSSYPKDTILFEKAVMSTIIILGYIHNLYFLVKVIEMFHFWHSSEIKYQEIMNQLEKYMATKRLPLTIKKSLIEFYQQRYQYRFFKEKTIHDNLSESLRLELVFQCAKLFINRIAIFDQIPKNILSNIVACLKQEIYMPNDLITKAGTVGDCMYFIASGTVSVRATSGKEFLHLEDGDHFGEVSILTKHGKRVSNTIAIEYCELYRLDKSDYEANIAIYPELAKKFETLAMQRMHSTLTVEEIYKHERNKKHKFDDDEPDAPESQK